MFVLYSVFSHLLNDVLLIAVSKKRKVFIVADEKKAKKIPKKNQQSEETMQKPREKMGKGKKSALIIFLVLIGLLLIGVIVGSILVSGFLNKVNYDDGNETLMTESRELETEAQTEEDIDSSEIDEFIQRHYEQGEMIDDPNVMNILLIGRDTASEKYYSRSDAMILLSINKRTKEMHMTSFLRDIYTYIPGKWYDKLNAAHSYGGPALLIETMEKSFKIHIDNYVSVNFKSFPEVIDALGGVEINVKKSEIKHVNSGISPDDPSYFTEPGTHLLNGTQALSYSRIRKVDSDVVRAQRQRNVLSQIITKTKTASVGQIYNMLNALLPHVTTDFTKSELLGQAVNALSYASYDLTELSVPFDGMAHSATINTQWVWVIDFEENTRKLQDEIYGFNTVDAEVMGY